MFVLLQQRQGPIDGLLVRVEARLERLVGVEFLVAARRERRVCEQRAHFASRRKRRLVRRNGGVGAGRRQGDETAHAVLVQLGADGLHGVGHDLH
jgi:hypothetical protein